MRSWRTEMHIRGGEDYPESCSTIYKSFSMKQVKEVLDSIRGPEVAEGLPKRKLKPISRYILEHLIQVYFEEYAPKKAILEKIIIKDTKDYGL